MSIWNSLKQIMKPDDDFASEMEESGELFPPLKKKMPETLKPSGDEKVVNIMAATQHRVVILSPKNFKEAYSSIADHLRDRHILVINLERTNKEDSRNLIYFVGGVCHALDGELQIIATNTYMAIPASVQLEGVVDDLLDQLENTFY